MNRYLTNILIGSLMVCSLSWQQAVAKKRTADNILIQLLTQQIKPGHEFEVKVSSNTTMDSKAWLGVFKPNVAKQNTASFESYQYVGTQNGKVVKMRAPIVAGAYELRFFSADPGTFVKALPFKVVNIHPDQYQITLVTTQIKPSHSFEAKVATNYKMDPKAWLGVFKSGVSEAPSNFLSYEYVGKLNQQNVTLTAPTEPGDYELRFYSADPGALIQQIPFRVGQLNLPGISFSLNKKAYAHEEEIEITYIGHADLTKNAWIGLFKSMFERYCLIFLMKWNRSLAL